MAVRERARCGIGAAALVAVGCALLGACSQPSSASPAPASAVAPPSVPSFVATPSPVVAPPPVVTTPPPPGPEGPRPSNGQVFVRTGGKGSGVLTVDNGGSEDAYATLALGKKIIRGMYVQAGQQASVSDIPDGTYDLYFATGNGWNRTLRQFTSDRNASRYDDQFDYTTSGGQYTEWTASLRPVAGGNASTSDVSDADLPN